MCPGLRRSIGRDSWSARTWIVVARSCELIPVVTPKRCCASTDTVNAVPWGSVFRSVMSGSSSASARSGVSATQMRPRPCFAMKFTWSAVISEAAQTRSPSFSRSSSSATMTILPARISSIAASMESKATVALSVSEARHRSVAGPGEELTHIFADQVPLDIQRIPAPEPAEIRHFPGVGNDGDLDAVRGARSG